MVKNSQIFGFFTQSYVSNISEVEGATVKQIWAEALIEVRYALLGEGKQTFSKQY